jgi:diguanylate cyclase (GGDEF)-like protein
MVEIKKSKYIIVLGSVLLSLSLLLIAAGVVTVADDGSRVHRLVAGFLVVLSLFPPVAASLVLRSINVFVRQAEQFATRDPLTYLYNQKTFWDYLGYEIERAKRHKYRFSIMLVDLDDFKITNDLHGHETGDAYLCEFSTLFKTCIRRGDIAARYGGDNFAAILPVCDEAQAYIVAKRLNESIRENVFHLPDGSMTTITVSIGMAVYPDHAQDALALFHVADSMLHEAKVLGKDRIGIPSDDLNIDWLKSAGEKSIFIMESIRQKRIVPYFQPIVDVKKKTVMAYEVLTRIVMPERVVSAVEFIEEAEGMGAIGKIDYLLIEQALAAVKRHAYQGKLFFNLSPKALVMNEFMPTMRGFMDQYGVEPKQLVFEITERDTVKNLSQVESIIHGLKDDGFQLAIDDFGAGYSSFQYIKTFKVDYLKVDGDFIKSMNGDNSAMEKAIVSNIASLAAELGIKTIAESVESQSILDDVRSAGINFAQGYFIRHPLPDLNL